MTDGRTNEVATSKEKQVVQADNRSVVEESWPRQFEVVMKLDNVTILSWTKNGRKGNETKNGESRFLSGKTGQELWNKKNKNVEE